LRTLRVSRTDLKRREVRIPEGFTILVVDSDRVQEDTVIARKVSEAGEETIVSDVGSRYQKVAFRFRAGESTDQARLSLTMTQPGYLWVACLSLMPADNVRGMRADTLALLKQLNAPIYRWPGGNFVSGYHWKDGLGPRDGRPPRWERAWEGVEDNDFGIDEFLDFCREIQTEPLVVVNTGLGSVSEAVQQVEYVNGDARTFWGARRERPAPLGSRLVNPVLGLRARVPHPELLLRLRKQDGAVPCQAGFLRVVPIVLELVPVVQIEAGFAARRA